MAIRRCSIKALASGRALVKSSHDKFIESKFKNRRDSAKFDTFDSYQTMFLTESFVITYVSYTYVRVGALPAYLRRTSI